MTENHSYFEEIVSQLPQTELGNLFGKPCGKTGQKAFVSFFQEEMVFKIGREEVESLKEQYEGSQNWDPSGKNRPMKDWLQVPETHKEAWQDLAEKALRYQRSLL